MSLNKITISKVNGPLFLIDAIEEDDFEQRADLLLLLKCTYPFFFKKNIGWRLSIEELEFLVCDAPRHGWDVCLVGLTVIQQRETLKQACPSACTIYRVLTRQHGCLLRHGTQFGALFIGYTDLRQHGDVLFFLGPLSFLERVAATRVSRGVGKRAVECECLGEEVCLHEMTNPCDSSILSRRKKRRKLHESQ